MLSQDRNSASSLQWQIRECEVAYKVGVGMQDYRGVGGCKGIISLGKILLGGNFGKP